MKKILFIAALAAAVASCSKTGSKPNPPDPPADPNSKKVTITADTSATLKVTPGTSALLFKGKMVVGNAYPFSVDYLFLYKEEGDIFTKDTKIVFIDKGGNTILSVQRELENIDYTLISKSLPPGEYEVQVIGEVVSLTFGRVKLEIDFQFDQPRLISQRGQKIILN